MAFKMDNQTSCREEIKELNERIEKLERAIGIKKVKVCSVCSRRFYGNSDVISMKAYCSVSCKVMDEQKLKQ
jgi:hypothetical protein